MSATARAPILLVEHDEQRSALFGGWLQGAGYEVPVPGPSDRVLVSAARRSLPARRPCPLSLTSRFA
jgi:hypothetical protein